MNIVLAFGFRSTLGAKGLALSLSVAYSVAAVAALVGPAAASRAASAASASGATCCGRWPARSSWPSSSLWFSRASGRTTAWALLVRVTAAIIAGVVSLRAGGGTRRKRCRLADFEATARGCREGGSWPGSES